METMEFTMIETGWLSILPPIIAIVLALLWAVVSLVSKSGGSEAYGRWAGKRLKTKRSASFTTSLLGVLIFIDDGFNCLPVVHSAQADETQGIYDRHRQRHFQYRAAHADPDRHDDLCC